MAESPRTRQVGLGVGEHLSDGGECAGEHVGDQVDVRAALGLSRLGEVRADGRGDHLLVVLARLGQHVAHEVDSAALPGTALQDRPDGVDQAAVGIADDQLDTVQAAVTQVAEELGAELLGLAVTGRAAQHLTAPIGADAGSDDDGLGDDSAGQTDLAIGRVQKM